jgi:hypothetical protein
MTNAAKAANSQSRFESPSISPSFRLPELAVRAFLFRRRSFVDRSLRGFSASSHAGSKAFFDVTVDDAQSTLRLEDRKNLTARFVLRLVTQLVYPFHPARRVRTRDAPSRQENDPGFKSSVRSTGPDPAARSAAGFGRGSRGYPCPEDRTAPVTQFRA